MKHVFILAIQLLLLQTVRSQTHDSLPRLFDFENNLISRNPLDNRSYTELRNLFFYNSQQPGSDSAKKYRVLHLGDSHIQGDGFTGRVRQVLNRELQRVGEGIVFPDKFGQSYGQKSVTGTSSGRWLTSQVMKGVYKEQVGITGYTYTLLDSVGVLRFVFKERPFGCLERNVEIAIRSTYNGFAMVPGSNWRLRQVSKSAEDIWVYQLQSQGCLDTLTVTFRNPEFASAPLHFLGIQSSWPAEAVTYQRSAVTGSQLLHWDRNAGFIGELHRFKPDLIIVSLGTNDAYNSAIRNTGFGQRLLDFIDSLRAQDPQVTLLFTTPPPSRGVNRSLDRYEYVLSEMSVKLSLRDVLVYDLNGIMGGETGIDAWNKRLLIARDLIHYKKEGYVLQADLFLLALGSFLGLSEDVVLEAPSANILRYMRGG